MQAVLHLPVLRRLTGMWPAAVLLAAFLLLAACAAPASPPAAEQAAAESTASAEAAASGTAATTEKAASAEAASVEAAAGAAAAQAAGECEAGFRLFDHELLLTEPVCIPANPERVLPLDMASLEMTLLAGKTPVATSEWMLGEMPLLIPEFADALAPLEGVGYPANLEQVALLAPDLILAPQDTLDVEQAGAIAPVIVPDPVIYEDWKLGMEFWAAALNLPERYVAMEENYRKRVAELQSALGDAANAEISVISLAPNYITLWMPDTAPGAILTDVGLGRPVGQRLVGDAAIAEYGSKQWIQISNERADLMEGDAIFYFTYASVDPEDAQEANDSVSDFVQQPVWSSLDAVKAGRAYWVPGHWWRAQTYYLANKVIDDLFANLTGTAATTPVLPLPEP